MLRVRDLAKSYGGHPAVSDVSFEVDAGEVVALLGPNGAGKSTTLSMIAGLLVPDRGTVDVDGTLGFAPQATGVHLALTVAENLQFYAELAGVPRRTRRARIDETAGFLGLSGLMDRRAQSLSGGEARRLHTAAAIVGRPDVLLLDEPTVGADIGTRQALLDAVNSLAAEGSAVVYTTHYLPEVEELGADIVIINDGVVIAAGSQQSLKSAHAASAVEIGFRGPAPDLRLDGTRVEIDPIDDSVLRIFSPHPPVAAVRALEQLGPHGERVLSIELVAASLDAVFLELTGARYDEEGQ